MPIRGVSGERTEATGSRPDRRTGEKGGRGGGDYDLKRRIRSAARQGATKSGILCKTWREVIREGNDKGHRCSGGKGNSGIGPIS